MLFFFFCTCFSKEAYFVFMRLQLIQSYWVNYHVLFFLKGYCYSALCLSDPYPRCSTCIYFAASVCSTVPHGGYPSTFIHSSSNQLSRSCLQLHKSLNCAAINTLIHIPLGVCVRNLLGYKPRSGLLAHTAGLCKI